MIFNVPVNFTVHAKDQETAEQETWEFIRSITLDPGPMYNVFDGGIDYMNVRQELDE